MRFALALVFLGVVLFATRWLWRFALRPKHVQNVDMPVRSAIDKLSRWLALAVALVVTLILGVLVLKILLVAGDE